MKFINENKLLIAVTCIIIPFTLYAIFSNYAESPVDNRNVSVTIEIPKGANYSNVTALLDKAGLIKHERLFHLLARLKNAPTHIRAGEYDLSSSMSPADIIDKLIKGEIKGYRVPIPEGFNIRQIAARLAAIKLVNEEEFIKAASDPKFVSSLGIDSSSVEGYLFPDTYILSRSMGAKKTIKFMVGRFRQAVTPKMLGRARELGFSTSEFVTLASIIEKEGGTKEEKALISAVFHNRLKKRMRLQSDPTVIYGMKSFDGNIKKKHLREKTPYNTYTIKGLPPGPISNPGLDSLLATLYPAPVNYLYFVSKNNGSHHFSSNLTSHNKAVLKYQIKRRKR
ncbi:MAG: endolytic transglycosylase MltG [Proteobacteria bacterium]|nr:endolytic transglycosylase MltG [Pseudomonadota bacterium]